MSKSTMLLSMFALLLVNPAFAQAVSNCPVINGLWALEKHEGDVVKRFTTLLNTRQTKYVFSYTVDREGTFQVADGIARPHRVRGVEATVKITCTDGMVQFETQAVGSSLGHVQRVKPLNKNAVSVETNIPGKSGIYVRRSRE